MRSKSTGHLQRKVKDKQSSKSDPEEEQDLEVKVIKIKEESVALKEGQVKKHKKGGWYVVVVVLVESAAIDLIIEGRQSLWFE